MMSITISPLGGRGGGNKTQKERKFSAKNRKGDGDFTGILDDQSSSIIVTINSACYRKCCMTTLK